MIAAGPDEGLVFSITGGETAARKAGLELIRSTDFNPQRTWLSMDRGYSAYVTIEVCAEKGLVAVVPPKSSHKQPWEYHRWIYVYRNEIERLFGRLKHYRRIATRFDKLARRYAAFLQIALISRFLQTYVNTT